MGIKHFIRKKLFHVARMTSGTAFHWFGYYTDVAGYRRSYRCYSRISYLFDSQLKSGYKGDR